MSDYYKKKKTCVWEESGRGCDIYEKSEKEGFEDVAWKVVKVSVGAAIGAKKAESCTTAVSAILYAHGHGHSHIELVCRERGPTFSTSLVNLFAAFAHHCI
ncbi:hypothetical protein V6N11_074283 [Hibiscus sabdariffa]|uniref:Uncharacterized protein n=1 Tax=Hibiscus sabdariffa TaxID=183260 RepID=A0ABR1ZG82_9ROSI